MAFETINPTTGEILKSYSYQSQPEREKIIARSENAFLKWRDAGINYRTNQLVKLAKAILDDKEQLAQLITLEMGKPIAESLAEVEKCAKLADYMAEHGAQFLVDEKAPVTELEAYVSFEPLGPLLAVMPWNFPLWQALRFSIPSLLAGNTILLKHAHNVVGSSLALEQTFRSASFDEGIFQNLIMPVEELDSVVSDRRVRGVSLTGSGRAGSSLAQLAGKHLKKCVLELGGTDAFIVLKDANLKAAAIAAVKSRFGNAGQVCIAAKRFIVVKEVAEEFQTFFLEEMKRLVMGPLARADLRDTLHEQVEKSVKLGAKILAGGKPKPGPGAFYEPTLLTNVTLGMPVYGEETFGPVATLFVVNDEQEAIKLSNATDYGLSSALWTRDIEKAKRLARQIEAGGVFINSISQSDPRIPIGGVKQSGFGRELSHFGIREFTNVKTVWVGIG
jgi:succinate-semialdehyde dehydrogenase